VLVKRLTGKSQFKLFLLALAAITIVVVSLFLWQLAGVSRINSVILISIDTLRADHLGCYGFEDIATPTIDALAAEGILFENAFTPVPLTLPAHCSMLTGTYPPYHKVHENLNYRLSESNITIAEILRERAFATAAVISAFVLDPQFGLSQGFDSYNHKFIESIAGRADLGTERLGDETSRFACEYLEQHKDESFFLFLHYFDPHTYYSPPEPFATEYRDDLYSGEIAYTDYCLADVIDKLKELNLYESALIILVSDHGEGLGEHGESEHGYFIYPCTTRVPFIIKPPGGLQDTRRITDTVSLVDVVPTILSCLKIDIPDYIQGKDLFVYGRKTAPANENRSVYTESFGAVKYGCNPLFGLVNRQFEYINTTRPELYELSGDYSALTNLVDTNPERARLMKNQLLEMLPQLVGKNVNDSEITLDAESRKRLESLGYVSGEIADTSFELDPAKPDPKDLIGYHEDYQQAINSISTGRFTEAVLIGRKMLRDWPNIPDTYLLLARAVIKRGQLKEAINYSSRYLSLINQADVQHFEARRLHTNKKKYTAHNILAKACFQLRQYDKTIEHLNQIIRLNPEETNALNNLAWIMAAGKTPNLRDPNRAIQLAEKACELTDFNQPNMLDTLAAAYASAGRFDEAVEVTEKALRLARAAKVEQMITEIEGHLQLYLKGQPFYEQPER